MRFYKYHGLGNDYLVIDPSRQTEPRANRLTPALVRAICHRRRGVGSDGIVCGPLAGGEPGVFACEIWNPDGSRAEISGNGLRIFARYLLDAGYLSLAETRHTRLRSGGRTLSVRYGESAAAPIRVELGAAHIPPLSPTLPPEVTAALGAAVAVDVGNPHCVFFPAVPIDESLARRWGPVVESHRAFPKRTNVQFVRVIDTHTLAIEIWERGAGYTQASGSSSCAAALAAIQRGFCRSPVVVRMPGGELTVAVETDGTEDGEWRVALSGPVTPVFWGEWTGANEDRTFVRIGS